MTKIDPTKAYGPGTIVRWSDSITGDQVTGLMLSKPYLEELEDEDSAAPKYYCEVIVKGELVIKELSEDLHLIPLESQGLQDILSV